MSSVAAEEAASSEGPVLSLMSKRLRALRKKYNRITQMEERVAEGKPLNKEQEEVLRSKTAVAALIDEYEKLRLPLSSALHDELSRLSTPSPSPPEPSDPDETLEDLVGLLYFGCLFDVKPQAEFTATMLARTHERGCCLTYDYVTDEATELLGERDLDAISSLGALVTSRPASSGVSHKNALRGCVEQAKLWLRRSDQPIHQGASITYAGLREKLSKIMASDYFTTTPEMKAPVDVAAAVGKYNTSCQVQVSEPTMVPAPDVQSDGSPALYQHKEDEQDDFQAAELVPDQSSPVDEHPEDEADMPNALGDITSSQEEQQNQTEPDVEEQNQRDLDQKEQQSFPRRGGYQNPRGGIRGGGGGGRRGYPNGRGGGRGGRGGYQNGRNQYFDPGYYPRNYYNTRGRGGRSGGGPAIYNNHGGGAAGGGGHVAENAE